MSEKKDSLLPEDVSEAQTAFNKGILSRSILSPQDLSDFSGASDAFFGFVGRLSQARPSNVVIPRFTRDLGERHTTRCTASLRLRGVDEEQLFVIDHGLIQLNEPTQLAKRRDQDLEANREQLLASLTKKPTEEAATVRQTILKGVLDISRTPIESTAVAHQYVEQVQGGVRRREKYWPQLGVRFNAYLDGGVQAYPLLPFLGFGGRLQTSFQHPLLPGEQKLRFNEIGETITLSAASRDDFEQTPFSRMQTFVLKVSGIEEE
jgi:hypothetical protein